MPLPAPIVVFGVEQASADRRAEHVVVERLLGIALGVVEQDRLDQGRVHDEQRVAPEPAVADHRLLIEILAPAGTGFPIMRNISMGKEGRPLGGTGLSAIVASVTMGPDTIWPASQDSCKQGS